MLYQTKNADRNTRQAALGRLTARYDVTTPQHDAIAHASAASAMTSTEKLAIHIIGALALVDLLPAQVMLGDNLTYAVTTVVEALYTGFAYVDEADIDRLIMGRCETDEPEPAPERESQRVTPLAPQEGIALTLYRLLTEPQQQALHTMLDILDTATDADRHARLEAWWAGLTEADHTVFKTALPLMFGRKLEDESDQDAAPDATNADSTEASQ